MQVFISISHNLDIIFTTVYRASKQRLPTSSHTLITPGWNWASQNTQNSEIRTIRSCTTEKEAEKEARKEVGEEVEKEAEKEAEKETDKEDQKEAEKELEKKLEKKLEKESGKKTF